jgi:MFS family permease
MNSSVSLDGIYRRIYWRLIPFLMLCYLLASIDRTNIGFGKLEFAGQLGFNDAVYGLGAGLFYLGYLSLELPSNLWLQRVGVRLTLMRIMVLWGLCCALLALMTSRWHYYGLRMALGAAEAGFFPGVLFYLTRWAPAARRARITALFMSSLAVSGVLGGPISAQILGSMGGVAGLAAWQWLFILEGVPAMLVGVAAWYYLPESPEQARWLNPADKAALRADLQRDRPPIAPALSYWQALRLPQFHALALMAFALTGGAGAIFTWLPSIFRRAGVSNVWEIGLLSALPFLLAVAVQLAVAWHSDRHQERRWHAALPALVAAAGWFALCFVDDDPRRSLLAMCVIAAGTFGAMGPFWTLPPRLLPGAAVAALVALVTTAGGFGNFIGPIIVGEIATRSGSLAGGYVYFGVVLLAAALAVLRFVRRNSTGK